MLPPDTVSPAAGQFVVSLLRENLHTRLGTSKDSEVKKSSFFKGVNWSAMALGLTSPAFVCGHAEVVVVVVVVDVGAGVCLVLDVATIIQSGVFFLMLVVSGNVAMLCHFHVHCSCYFLQHCLHRLF